MLRCVSVIIGMWSCLGVPFAAAGTVSKGELEQQLLTYLNERMYNSVKSVVLTRETDDGYEGFVRFANGRRSDVKVTVTEEKIEYAFVGRATSDAAPRPAADPNAPTVIATQDPVYTQQMYRRIEKGMSYAQVADIAGDPGSRISSSCFDGAVNEVWIWANPDDSHICVVFRDGKVLVRTQSGLPQAFGGSGPQRADADYFDNWLLAKRIDGRIVPLDLSFGQWLAQVREAAANASGKPRIDVVEEDNQVIVELSHNDAESAVRETHLYLTCLSVQELGPNAPEAATVERICIPASVQVDGKQDGDPARAWEIMTALMNP